MDRCVICKQDSDGPLCGHECRREVAERLGVLTSARHRPQPLRARIDEEIAMLHAALHRDIR